MTEYHSFSMPPVYTHDHTYYYYHLLQDFYIFILSDLLITKFAQIYKKKRTVIAHKCQDKFMQNELEKGASLEIDSYVRLLSFALQFCDYLLLLSCENSLHQLQ